MNKSYRISWNAQVEDESVLEGRSLVLGESPEDAARKLVESKSQEYRVKPRLIYIESIMEIQA
ncbi:hypothetical protein D0469_12830 [Peribacillus saganii]|uniref:Uncharacterized protein n=1 Tax=Peribacillus saganii TaxID=2303992 RepID=A0A372LM31_9BACI|nr:hypothetical protein [Peribacillus saganii]RFU68146.1 hypothetical protein D0469_12830 [Peribacillus saganii]